MKRLSKALLIVTSLITATGLQAQSLEQQSTAATNTIQRYTFTYDFNNTVHPVVQRIKEQQQYIQYDLVTEVQQQAYNSINDIGNGTLVVDNSHVATSDRMLAK